MYLIHRQLTTNFISRSYKENTSLNIWFQWIWFSPSDWRKYISLFHIFHIQQYVTFSEFVIVYNFWALPLSWVSLGQSKYMIIWPPPLIILGVKYFVSLACQRCIFLVRLVFLPPPPSSESYIFQTPHLRNRSILQGFEVRRRRENFWISVL